MKKTYWTFAITASKEDFAKRVFQGDDFSHTFDIYTVVKIMLRILWSKMEPEKV